MNKNQIVCISIIVLLLILIPVLLIITIRSVTKTSKIRIETYKDFTEPAIGHPGSCIDCENQFAPTEKWRGQPSKCFSCERDMQRRHGNDSVFLATKQKCFDC